MNILVVSSLVLVEKMDKGIGCDSQTVTAAVSVGAYILYDESQSLGNWEGRAWAAGEFFSTGVSQKTCLKIS